MTLQNDTFYDVKFSGPGRTIIPGQIKTYSRNGTKSPTLYMFYVNGKRLTPFAQTKLGIHLSLMSLWVLYLKVGYSDVSDLIYDDNPLLAAIPKGDAWVGGNYIAPISLPSPVADVKKS